MSNIDLYTVNDTFISMNTSNINYGNSPYLLVGEDVDKECIYDAAISYLYFDFLELENFLPVTHAELFLYLNPHDYHGCSFEFPLEVYIISSYYDASQVTWNTGSQIYPSGYGTTIRESDENNYISIDITNLTRNFIDKAMPNFGIALVGKSYDKQIYISSSKACNQPFIRLEFNNFNQNLLESYNKRDPHVLPQSNRDPLADYLGKSKPEPISTYQEDFKPSTAPMCQGYENNIPKRNHIPIYNPMDKNAHSPYYIPFYSEGDNQCCELTPMQGGLENCKQSTCSTPCESNISCCFNGTPHSDIGNNCPCCIEGITGATGPMGPPAFGITGATGMVGPTGATGATGLNIYGNKAMFIKSPCTDCIGNERGIPFDSLCITANGVFHTNGTSAITLAPNNTYFATWQLTVETVNAKFNIGASLVLDNSEILGSRTRTSMKDGGDKVSLSTSVVFNTGTTAQILELRYLTNSGVRDKIECASLTLVQIK